MNHDKLWVETAGPAPILATAIHAGHGLRPEVAALMRLSEEDRLREEDPHTERIAEVATNTMVPTRSRFEVDLNRRPDEAVYASSEQAWGLDLWKAPPNRELLARSLEVHQAFYSHLEERLRALEREHGAFVVLDVHSYNHRRSGPAAPPEDPALNPVVNVGTGSVNRELWGPVVARFVSELGAQSAGGELLDVRENVKFRGRYLAEFVHTRFPESGCALALEFKKTFMDEWSGEVDEAHLAELALALGATIPGLLASLDEL